MSETTRPENFRVNAARGIAEINQRLGDTTPDLDPQTGGDQAAFRPA